MTRAPAARASLFLLCGAVAFAAYHIAPRFPRAEGLDIVADWLVTQAAVEGDDPYANPERLARRYGVEYHFLRGRDLDPASVSHPRTPGALVAMTPLTLVPPSRVHALATALTMVSLVIVFLLGCEAAGLPLWLVPALALLALVTTPTLVTLFYASQSGFVALLVTAGMWWASRRDSPGGGVLLGVASVLKVFPVLLVVPLWMTDRRRTGTAVLGTIVVLTLAGLAFPGVSPNGAFAALRSASKNWLVLTGNGSLARGLALSGVGPEVATIVAGLSVATLAIALFAWTAARQMPRYRLLCLTLAISLLWVPLSWFHYDMVLYPVALLAGAILWRSEWRLALRLAGVSLVALLFLPWPVDPGGVAALRRLSLAVILLSVGPHRSESRSPRSVV